MRVPGSICLGGLGLPLGIPAGVFGEGEGRDGTHGRPFACYEEISFYANVGSKHSGRVVELCTLDM